MSTLKKRKFAIFVDKLKLTAAINNSIAPHRRAAQAISVQIIRISTNQPHRRPPQLYNSIIFNQANELLRQKQYKNLRHAGKQHKQLSYS